MTLPFYDKLPCAPERVRMLIRRTGDASRPYPRIHGLGKLGILHDADTLAGEVVKPLAFACRLHPAVEHAEHHPVIALLDHVLEVQAGIEAVLETFHEGRNAAARLHLQP